MNNQGLIIRFSGLFILYLFLQVFLVRNIELFGLAFGFIYVGFILTLPLSTPPIWMMLLGFLSGFIVDGFYDTLGIHTFATVFIAYLRPYLINLLSGKNEITSLKMDQTGLYWFMSYVFSLVLIHHLLIFFFQRFNFVMFFDTLIRVLASSVFSLILIILMQYLIYSPGDRNE